MEKHIKIGIVGRKKDTVRYERFLDSIQTDHITSLVLGELSKCAALLFPGGGDITPAFFGEHNNGSYNIDTELDILQLQAFQYALDEKLPVLGICKGMQLINVGLGGNVIQNMPTAESHRYVEADQYHDTVIDPSSFLYELYGGSAVVNSAHHQCVSRLGRQLIPIQWCPADQCVEAIRHISLPVIGVQWHPERLLLEHTPISGKPLFDYFLSLI